MTRIVCSEPPRVGQSEQQNILRIDVEPTIIKVSRSTILLPTTHDWEEELLMALRETTSHTILETAT
jgi:hypothetical protein